MSRGIKLEEAQDTVQDVFVKMLEMDLLIAPSKLRSWMYRVALRDYIDRYRRDKRYEQILATLSKELSNLTQPPPDLTTYLTRLKLTDQVLLKHFYYERMPVKALAKLTNASESKVKVGLYRARKRLRKILEKEGFDEWKT